MAITYKILAQSMTDNSNASVTLYTVPSGKNVTVSAIMITNTSGSSKTYRIAVVPSAESSGSVSSKHYIAYDTTLNANSTNQIRGGITLSAGDQIRIFGSTNEISINAYGAEI